LSAPTTLVTSHANADFDAFAAMLAVRHLCGPCMLLFPGTQERGLQKLFAELDKAAYGFVESAAVPWNAVERLVLVDTRQRSRIRHVDSLLDRDGVHRTAWDHHPDSRDDVPVDELHKATVGAVTSLLVGRLREEGIDVTPEEATLLGLGIYSDTGSFTYSSTTEEDFAAASWLLARKMDVNRISDMVSHEMTSLHVQALNSLLESATTYTFGGVPVVLAEASMDHYLGDFACLAHRIMEMEKFSVLFTLGLMGDRVQVVARSRIESVNVGDVCAALGGGGHAYAASATVREQTLPQVRETILQRLLEVCGQGRTARSCMNAPVLGLETGATMGEADEFMLHFGLKAIPVFARGERRCIGLLDAQTASRACVHGLHSLPVDEYMTRKVIQLSPESTLRDLTWVIVRERQRLVPIVEGEDVVGVVTRTDLINIFAGEPGIAAGQDVQAKNRSMGKILRERLPDYTYGLIRLAAALGKRLRLPVYLVGGFVRDLLLDRPNHDIDLVVEGNGIVLAEALAKELGGRVRAHEKFMTSVVIFNNPEGKEERIDVATARLEFYESPGALPTVELSSIRMDLARRDFSINALALRLDSVPMGEMVDFFGGQRDLKDRAIRALNSLSFVEDPTRCIRAVRFEQRYKLRITAGTEKLIRNALSLKMLDRISGDRLFHEYRLVCEESDPASCLLRMDELGMLAAISPSLALTPSRKELLPKVMEVFRWHGMTYLEETPCSWVLFYYALNVGLSQMDAALNYTRMGLPEARKGAILRDRARLRMLVRRMQKWQADMDAGKSRISEGCALLDPMGLETLLLVMAVGGDPMLHRNVSRYLTKLRGMRPDIDGEDLLAMGLPAGPIFRTILQETLKAKRDGTVTTREGQLQFAEHLVRELGAPV
jgi:tRNA nucleotidyltransferase (CCA-adding enzyme)